MNITVRHLLLAGIAAALAVGTIWWFWFRTSPEEQVRRRYHELVDAIQTSAGRNLLASASAGFTIADYFTDDVRIHAGRPLPNIDSKREWTSFIQKALAQLDTITIRTRGHDIEVPDNQHAVSTVVVECAVRGSGYAEKWFGDYELQWTLEDAWRIHEITRGPGIRNPALQTGGE